MWTQRICLDFHFRGAELKWLGVRKSFTEFLSIFLTVKTLKLGYLPENLGDWGNLAESLCKSLSYLYIVVQSVTWKYIYCGKVSEIFVCMWWSYSDDFCDNFFFISLQIQRYEGTSTIYGPHTFEIYLQQYRNLASGLMSVSCCIL